MKTSLFQSVFNAFVLSCLWRANMASAQTRADFDAAVINEMNRLNILGVGIVAMHKALENASPVSGPIIGGYGKTSAANNSPDVTTNTAFMLASVSKVFAGTAIGVMLDKKFIKSLDEDICLSLEGFASPTMGPTTNAPTTGNPTTAGPTTALPTTASPTTRAPTTASPTTATPTATPLGATPGPTTANPTTSSPTTSSPSTTAPTSRSPTISPGSPTAAPNFNAPTTGAPTTGSPTAGAPTTGSPTTGAPTAGAPTTGAPTTGPPNTGAPTTGAPTAGAPTTGNPSTSSPTTNPPTTSSPTTAAPTIGSPTTIPPTTATPLGVAVLGARNAPTVSPTSTTRQCQNPHYPNAKVTWRMVATHRSSLVASIPEVDVGQTIVQAQYGPEGGYDGSAAGNKVCPLTDLRGFYKESMVYNPRLQTRVGKYNLKVNGKLINWYDQFQKIGGAWNQTSQPGQYNDYSNLGIGYIGALIEHNLQKRNQPLSFEQFCQDNIFKRLKMNSTSWYNTSYSPQNIATPTSWNSVSNSHNNIGHYCFIDIASGQLYSTPNDMAKFGAAMVNKGLSLWSQATANSVFGCQERALNGKLSPLECSYSLAWEHLNNAKRDQNEFFYRDPFTGEDWTHGVEHAGFEEGVQTQILVLPEPGVYIVIMINTTGNDTDEASAQDMAAVVGAELMKIVDAQRHKAMTPDHATDSDVPPNHRTHPDDWWFRNLRG